MFDAVFTRRFSCSYTRRRVNIDHNNKAGRHTRFGYRVVFMFSIIQLKLCFRIKRCSRMTRDVCRFSLMKTHARFSNQVHSITLEILVEEQRHRGSDRTNTATWKYFLRFAPKLNIFLSHQFLKFCVIWSATTDNNCECLFRSTIWWLKNCRLSTSRNHCSSLAFAWISIFTKSFVFSRVSHHLKLELNLLMLMKISESTWVILQLKFSQSKLIDQESTYLLKVLVEASTKIQLKSIFEAKESCFAASTVFGSTTHSLLNEKKLELMILCVHLLGKSHVPNFGFLGTLHEVVLSVCVIHMVFSLHNAW